VKDEKRAERDQRKIEHDQRDLAWISLREIPALIAEAGPRFHRLFDII
jgi:hypothetical protein